MNLQKSVEKVIGNNVIVKKGEIAFSAGAEVQTITFDEPFPEGYLLLPNVHHGVTTNENYGQVSIGYVVTNNDIQISLANGSSGNSTPYVSWYVIGIKTP